MLKSLVSRWKAICRQWPSSRCDRFAFFLLDHVWIDLGDYALQVTTAVKNCSSIASSVCLLESMLIMKCWNCSPLCLLFTAHRWRLDPCIIAFSWMPQRLHLMWCMSHVILCVRLCNVVRHLGILLARKQHITNTANAWINDTTRFCPRAIPLTWLPHLFSYQFFLPLPSFNFSRRT